MLTIVKTRNIIRKKYQSLKTGKAETEIQLEHTFKPITQPLKELVRKTKYDNIKPEIKTEIKDEWETPLKHKRAKYETTSTPLRKYETLEDSFITPTNSLQYDSLQNHSMDLNDTVKTQKQSHNTQPKFMKSPHQILKNFSIKDEEIDDKYGPRLDVEDNRWKIGNSSFVHNNDSIVIEGVSYPLTPGLIQLVFMKKPNLNVCVDDDYKTYREILFQTSAFKRNYEVDGQISGSRSKKYTDVIKKLIDTKSSQHQGFGLMQINEQKPNYIYWDDPNELVDRLRLLVSSHYAGHNNHNNEIISIIEESNTTIL